MVRHSGAATRPSTWQGPLDGPGPGDQGIALREPGLGQLKRSGPYVRGSLVMRF